MELVNEVDELLANLLLLNAYVHRRHERETVDWTVDRIRRGKHFVAYRQEGTWLLGPSRFVGYIGNTRTKHTESDDKHGSRTDAAIISILADAAESPDLEEVYQAFCREHEVEPTNLARTFWTIR